MPETIEDLGRRVKAKYPGQYDDLGNAELGTRVKAKYPGQYDDFTDLPVRTSSTTTAPSLGTRFLANTVQAVDQYKHAAQGVGDVLQGIWDMGAKPPQEIQDAAQKGEWGRVAGLVLESAIPGIGMLVKPHLAEAETAYQYAKAGRPSEAIGHGVAAATPFVGPLVASVTETGAGEAPMPPGQQVGPVRQPDPERAAGQLATMYGLGSAPVRGEMLRRAVPLARGAVRVAGAAMHPQAAAAEALAKVILRAREIAKARGQARPVPSPTPEVLPPIPPEAYYAEQGRTYSTPIAPPEPAPQPVPVESASQPAPQPAPTTIPATGPYGRILADIPQPPPAATPAEPLYQPPTLRQRLEGLSPNAQRQILERIGTPGAQALLAELDAAQPPPVATLADLATPPAVEAGAPTLADLAAPPIEEAPAVSAPKAKRGGRKPKAAAVAVPATAEQPATLADLAQPQTAPAVEPATGTIADLSRQLNESIGAPAEAPPAAVDFEAGTRNEKAQAFAKYLHGEGAQAAHVADAIPLDNFWTQATTGVNQAGSRQWGAPSVATRKLIVDQMRTLEQPAPAEAAPAVPVATATPAPVAEPATPPSKYAIPFEHADALAKMVQGQGGTAAEAGRFGPQQWKELGVESPAASKQVLDRLATLEKAQPLMQGLSDRLQSANAAAVRSSLDLRRMSNPQTTATGPHGPIFSQFKGDAAGAVAQLIKTQDGEAPSALSHPEVGDIDLIWGKTPTKGEEGYGLAKIVAKHPGVENKLQDILDRSKVTSRSANRVVLSDPSHKAIVRLTFDGALKKWLLTAYEVAGGK